MKSITKDRQGIFVAIVNINANVNINLDRRILKLQQVPQCRGDAFPSHSQRFSLRTKREAGS